METIQRVRCPNCGNFAERKLLSDHQISDCEEVTQTECRVCDYFLVMSLSTGRVFEAYAPGQSNPYDSILIPPRFPVSIQKHSSIKIDSYDESSRHNDQRSGHNWRICHRC